MWQAVYSAGAQGEQRNSLLIPFPLEKSRLWSEHRCRVGVHPRALTALHGVFSQQQHQRLALDVCGALCFPHSYGIVCCRQMHVFSLWERSNYVPFYKLSLTREFCPTNLPLGKHWVRAVLREWLRNSLNTWSHHFPADYSFSLKAKSCLISKQVIFSVLAKWS